MPLNSETEINRMGSLYFTSLPQTQWKQISERQQKGGWWWVGLDQPSLWIQINPAGAEDPASQHHSMWESQWQVSTLRGTPKVQLLFDPKCSAHTCSTLLGWCYMHCKTIHPVTRTVKTIMLPLDGIISVYCWQSFFFFSPLLFRHFPPCTFSKHISCVTTWCFSLSAFRCQSILTLWQTSHSWQTWLPCRNYSSAPCAIYGCHMTLRANFTANLGNQILPFASFRTIIPSIHFFSCSKLLLLAS